MNFSQPPGSAAPTNVGTPLSFALALFTGIETHRTDISTFTTQLTAIHIAAYLLLLPRTTPAEDDFVKAEASRVTHGPFGDQVLHIARFFILLAFRDALGDDGQRQRMLTQDIYEATDRMLIDLAKEQELYLDNMTLLLAEMKAKWKVSMDETGS